MKKNDMMYAAFLHPRYWPTWIGLGLLWLLGQLPWSWQMFLGKKIGSLMFRVLKRRREIACINLELAFPDLSADERFQLNQQHFQSLGCTLFEMSLCWWGRESTLQRLLTFQGWEHLQAAREHSASTGQGIILLGAHFTAIELGGRLLSSHVPYHAVYREHQNPVVEYVVAKARTKRCGKVISRDDIRTMVRSLRQGQPVWYAPDQNFGHKGSVFSPFFGVSAATNAGVSRLASLGNALVVPFFTLRNEKGYQLVFLPALDDFPSENVELDVARVNRLIEAQIQQVPEQYLWTHRRFKDLPEGGNRYDEYRHSGGDCVKK